MLYSLNYKHDKNHYNLKIFIQLFIIRFHLSNDLVSYHEVNLLKLSFSTKNFNFQNFEHVHFTQTIASFIYILFNHH